MKAHFGLRILVSAFILATPASPGVPVPDELAQKCRQRLRLVGEATAAYRQNHQGQFPPELGDLVAKNWLSDPNILKCPAAIAAGLSSVRNPNDFVDPGATDSRVVGYNYELSQKPTVWEGDRYGFSLYRFKELQMESLVGRYMPVVRCSHHGDRQLNLTGDGSIYESGLYWEDNFVNILPGPRLAPELVKSSHLPMKQLVRPRPRHATVAMLDLRDWYNARFEDPWISAKLGQELTSFTMDLEDGLFASHGIAFEPAGIIQLNGKVAADGDYRGYGRLMYPTNMPAIKVNRPFHLMHILGGALYKSPTNTVVARLRFFRQDTSVAENWEWRFGVDVASLTFRKGEDEAMANTMKVAWTGDFEKGQESSRQARLFHLRFINPLPEKVVTHFDFHAGDGVSSPFIAAVTLE